MIKNILFDFDGVIAESVNVKSDAFYKMYLPFGRNIAEKVKKHHLDNGGMSRFRKFALYHKEFLNIELNENEINLLAKQFSDLVLEGVIESDLVDGVQEFLENNFTKYNFWIVTGTPTEEINIILKKKKLSQFFNEALGSPRNKMDITATLINNNKLKCDETCFIGDALADYEAALSNNIKFVLRETSENYHLFIDKKNISLKITNFIDFDKKILTL